MDVSRLLQGSPVLGRTEGGVMNTEQWFKYLNSLTEEELERAFVGMNVKVVMQAGKIVRVVNSAY